MLAAILEFKLSASIQVLVLCSMTDYTFNFRMQTIHDSRSIVTLIEKIATSTPKRGKYLPLHTLDPQIFLKERDIDMAMVQ